MELFDSQSCCGMMELEGVHDYEPRKVLSHIEGLTRKPIILFTDNSFGNGQTTADMIAANKLGGIVNTDWVTNRNTDNQIRAWLWTPDYEALQRFLEKR